MPLSGVRMWGRLRLSPEAERAFFRFLAKISGKAFKLHFKRRTKASSPDLDGAFV